MTAEQSPDSGAAVFRTHTAPVVRLVLMLLVAAVAGASILAWLVASGHKDGSTTGIGVGLMIFSFLLIIATSFSSTTYTSDGLGLTILKRPWFALAIFAQQGEEFVPWSDVVAVGSGVLRGRGGARSEYLRIRRVSGRPIWIWCSRTASNYRTEFRRLAQVVNARAPQAAQ